MGQNNEKLINNFQTQNNESMQLIQIRMNKKIGVLITKMLVKMENTNIKTLMSFKETNDILQDSSSNRTICGNAMNKLGTMVYLANHFFKLTEREIRALKYNLTIDEFNALKNYYLKKLDEIRQNNLKQFKEKNLNQNIDLYAEYYKEVLYRRFPEQPIEQVETYGIVDAEENKAQMQEFVNNFIEQSHVTEEMMKKIEEDPIVNQNIQHDNEVNLHRQNRQNNQ